MSSNVRFLLTQGSTEAGAALSYMTSFVQALGSKAQGTADPLQPPAPSDCLIHFDTPIGTWMPWAKVNILLLTTPSAVTGLDAAIRSMAAHFDAILVRHSETRSLLSSFSIKAPILLLPSTASQPTDELRTGWAALQTIVSARAAAFATLPPILKLEDCPPISVVTLTYNRRKFLDLAFHSLLITDYPKDKIEWIIVEDSDAVEEQASDKILKFARQAAPMSVSYIPMDKKQTIAYKRNEAVKRAQHDIVLMMDDDDHYPETSFRRRVAWLTQHPWAPRAVACTTIACYHLETGAGSGASSVQSHSPAASQVLLAGGASSVHIPPFTQSVAERVSEATLTFYKSFWEDRPFLDGSASVKEGVSFCKGREDEILELPPQHIIVAMRHAGNYDPSRYTDSMAGTTCFWGFPTEFLTFLHSLVSPDAATGGDEPSTSSLSLTA